VRGLHDHCGYDLTIKRALQGDAPDDLDCDVTEWIARTFYTHDRICWAAGASTSRWR